MKRSILFASLILFVAAVRVGAHEGDDSPGSLPPPPNGGRIAIAEEAHHDEQGEESHEEGLELFLEGKLEGTKLKLYPHSLDPAKPMIFGKIQPSGALKLVELRIELPRSKRTYQVAFTIVGDHWEADTGKVKDRRLLLYPTVDEKGERKTARIQIEK